MKELSLVNLSNEQLALYLAVISVPSLSIKTHISIADDYLKWLNKNNSK